MIELLAAAYIVGQVQISPYVVRTEYLNEDKEIIIIEEDKD